MALKTLLQVLSLRATWLTSLWPRVRSDSNFYAAAKNFFRRRFFLPHEGMKFPYDYRLDPIAIARARYHDQP